jgi:hypothetical protein
MLGMAGNQYLFNELIRGAMIFKLASFKFRNEYGNHEERSYQGLGSMPDNFLYD